MKNKSSGSFSLLLKENSKHPLEINILISEGLLSSFVFPCLPVADSRTALTKRPDNIFYRWTNADQKAKGRELDGLLGVVLEQFKPNAGGNGWWDSDIEDIDNEAVGSNEVWEGVRPATMGGLDWH
ncbi:hypothetical protein Tco_0973356 [Tanacetum coccineum]